MTTKDQQEKINTNTHKSSENSIRRFWNSTTFEQSKVKKVHHLTLNAQQKPIETFKDLSKDAIREKLADDIASYLAKGGEIKEIEPGVGVLETVFQDKN